MHDVAVVGAGIAGMATAARLQAAGLSTIVFEAHGQPGGCAGFFRRRGFAFDVGATTFVDFEPGGVGGELLSAIGIEDLERDLLPGYMAWLPDRTVELSRDADVWAAERRRTLGDSPRLERFWRWMDSLSAIFWRASRRGVKLPIQSFADAIRAVRRLGLCNLPAARFLNWTMGDALLACGLRDDRPLVGLLSMLLEDTVHAGIDDAPLINSALGISIRGAGLSRPLGGCFGFWRRFVARYRALGGTLRVGSPVERIESLGTSRDTSFRIQTRRGDFLARQVVSALPIALTSRLGPPAVTDALRSFLQRDAHAVGGAVVVFLGVPESEVAGHSLTHHQILHDYDKPLGDGNNMFISVSAAGDTESAPAGYCSVMISTHCRLENWERLNSEEYQTKKAAAGERLISLARRVYPNLGERAVVREVATPRTYERFTRRPRGAVGGLRQSRDNVNQKAVPHDIGVPGFWLAGDTTWPGLGTVACVLGSRIVAEGVLAAASRQSAPRERHSGASRVNSTCSESPNESAALV